VDKIEYHHEDLNTYYETNKMFAEVLSGMIQRDDVIWIHDYHMIPIGQHLKKLCLQPKVGFFLHTPFPNKDVFMTSATGDYPHPSELHKMLMYFSAYDLIGVQTPQDATNLNKLLVEYSFRATARTFPVAIDHKEIAQEANASEREARDWLDENTHQNIPPKKLVIGVDRLDYTKGIPERLHGFELMLRTHPVMRHQCLFVQISAVSRKEVKKYKQLEAQVSALVATIQDGFNKKAPVYWHKAAVPRSTVAGLCRIAQVALITPLADGMNLVAKEFVAAQKGDDPGVLVLSRYAGAALELGSTEENPDPGALIVDPYDASDVAESLYQALNMSLEERQARWKYMNQNVQRATAETWCTDFLKALHTS